MEHMARPTDAQHRQTVAKAASSPERYAPPDTTDKSQKSGMGRSTRSMAAAAAAISSSSRASSLLSDPPTTLPSRAPSLTPRVPLPQPGSPSTQLQSSLASAAQQGARESARRSASPALFLGGGTSPRPSPTLAADLSFSMDYLSGASDRRIDPPTPISQGSPSKCVKFNQLYIVVSNDADKILQAALTMTEDCFFRTASFKTMHDYNKLMKSL